MSQRSGPAALGADTVDRTELDIGGSDSGPQRTPRRAALDALERLLRAHVALSEQRHPEGPYGLLRPARDEELDLIGAVFLHCGVPLPDTLRTIYRRTLGVGNPVSALPVLSVPFLQAALPDEGHGLGPRFVGLDAFEKELGVFRDEAAVERPPFLPLGHAELAGLTVSRNGLWSIGDYRGRRDLPPLRDFNLIFETAFRGFVDQVLLLWANDLAGAVVRQPDLDLGRGARLEAMPAAVQDAMAHLLAPRSLSPRSWGDVLALDHADLLRATRRADGGEGPGLQGPGIVVVGLPYGDYPRVAGLIGPGTPLRMHPVDDNPHDENAVEVWFDGDSPARVGFVTRQAAPQVRALPQGAAAWRLRVTELSDQALLCALEAVGESGPQGTDTVDPSPSEGSLDLFAKAPRAGR